MTTENETAAEKSKSDLPATSESSGKGKNADNKAAMTAEYAHDEQDRRTVIWGSFLLMLLAAPVVLPMERKWSLWHMMRNDTTGRVIILVVFGIPFLLGFTGVLRGLRRNVPKGAFWVFSFVATGLFVLAGIALMAMILIYERRAVNSPWIWLGAFASLSAALVFVRSFLRQRWQRFQHLIAAFGFLTLMIILTIAEAESYLFDRTGPGGWLFLFATAALAPVAGSTLFSKRPN